MQATSKLVLIAPNDAVKRAECATVNINMSDSHFQL
jgi:hypothetical protein